MSIDGLKFSITTQKLSSLLEEREKFHRLRHEKLAQRAETRGREDEEDREESDEMAAGQTKYAMSASSMLGGPMSLAQRARHHLDRSTVFRFMRENLIANETYILTEDDLRRLEVLSPGY
jgi:hypothetical protein